MSKELVIGSNRHETKVAILEEDQLVEVYFQRANEYSLAGSIHKGRVTRVLPGMQSAFVDLGLERDTFLYVSDFFEEHDDIDTVLDEKPPRNERGGRGERRDRGAFDRPPQEVAAVADTQLASPESELPEERADEEDETPHTALATPASTEARPPEQARIAERPDDDRNRGNDRRGRRSRRRRRGRDFPDNKYARPNAPPSQSSSIAARSDEATAAVDEAKAEFNVASRQDEPIDVIVLPGESLAKYRSRPAIVEPAPAPVAAFAAAAEPSDPLEPSDEETEIEEEAAEIKISDQVFSHQPTAEIDPPLEPAPAREDALGRAASYLGVDRATHSDALEEERLRVEKFLNDPSPANLPEPDESELLVADESLPDVEDLAPEIEEALENGIDEPYFAATVDVEPPAPQSAVVRDQGNRSLHRAPRRMRRRRGGSGRFNQGGPSNSAAAPSPATGATPRKQSRSTRGRRTR